MANTYAVMAQRKDPQDPAASLDFFPTPPWATRALCKHVLVGNGWLHTDLRAASCWEPACGQGHMVRPLAEYFASVRASDVHDYGQGEVNDFLFPSFRADDETDFIITNPPFNLAAEFVAQALRYSREAVAMLVRTAFLEGKERYYSLFSVRPPMIVAPFVERVPMVKGRLDRKASSATSYTWIVWPGRLANLLYATPTRVVWIPPCRAKLERDSDYEVAS